MSNQTRQTIVQKLHDFEANPALTDEEIVKITDAIINSIQRGNTTVNCLTDHNLDIWIDACRMSARHYNPPTKDNK